MHTKVFNWNKLKAMQFFEKLHSFFFLKNYILCKCSVGNCLRLELSFITYISISPTSKPSRKIGTVKRHLLELSWPGLFRDYGLRGHSTTSWTEFFHFLTPPPCVDSFYTLSVDKNRHFLTPYPLILST